MRKTLTIAFVVGAAIAVPLGAQPSQRRASLNDNGNPTQGKCVIDVVVFGAADLEIRGDNAVLRNADGQRPEWRGFDCTSRVPDYPVDLRVRSIAGRGDVQLVRNPNGDAVMVQIEGRSNAAERYTLELVWAAKRPYYNDGARANPPLTDSDSNQRRDLANQGVPLAGSNSNQRRDVENQNQKLAAALSTDGAIRACEDEIRQEAGQRLGPGQLEFRNGRLDSTPERRDMVIGGFTFFSRDRSEVAYRFSCAVDFSAGRVRSANFDQLEGDAYASPRDANASRLRVPSPIDAAITTCQDAVGSRIERMGYSNVSFTSIDMDQRAGRDEWVMGNARGMRSNRSARFDFSCRMDFNRGNVRSLNVKRR